MARIDRYLLLALISVVLIGCRVSDRQKVAALRAATGAVLLWLDEEPVAAPEVADASKVEETICPYERNARFVRVVNIKAEPEIDGEALRTLARIERLRVRAMAERDRARAVILVTQPSARI